jgi:glutathione S-transferase
MKLFYVPGTCALSPHIALLEAGLPFDLCLVDRETKQVKGVGDYLKINARGYVPALQLDDGRVLTEGAAIVQYIADQAPEKNLAPKAGTFERYQLQEMLNFIATEVHKGFSPLFNPKLPDDLRKTYADRLGTRFDWIEQQLASKPFLMGNAFTIADGYLFTVLGWAPRVKIDLAKWPHIQSYLTRVADRPTVAAAKQAEA